MGLDEETIGRIEYEIAILARRATAVNARNNLGTLDRSAYLLLGQLEEGGPLGVKALADEFRLDISTVSRQTAALESKGYVKRLPDPLDRRASSFQITPLGLEHLNQTRQSRLAVHSQLLHGWSEEDAQKFWELLRRFNRTFTE